MRHRKWLVWLAVGVALAGLLAGGWGLLPRLESQASTLRAARSQDQDTNHREADGDCLSPTSSFIDSPSPTCSLPKPGTNVCYIDWSYIYVAASSGQYIITSTITLDGGVRAYVGGFFQSYMYLPGTMLAPGFQVPCGTPGTGELSDWGASYAYTIRARETGGLSAANYGTVTCPFDIVPMADLVLVGPDKGFLGQPYMFETSVMPVTTTLPVTYTWTATGQTPTVIVNGTNASHTFTWLTEGDKVVTVTAENMNSSMIATLVISISPYELYLPLVRR